MTSPCYPEIVVKTIESIRAVRSAIDVGLSGLWLDNIALYQEYCVLPVQRSYRRPTEDHPRLPLSGQRGYTKVALSS